MINQNFLNMLNSIISEKEINKFIDYCQRPLKKSIKININKILPEKFEEITKEYGRKLSKHSFLDKAQKIPIDTFYIDRENTEVPLGKTFLHKSGFFYVQEIAAGLTPRFLDIDENDLVLDISASPGGKSIQIGDYLLYLNKKKPGFLISNDIKKAKITTLAHNLNRNGIYNSGISKFNGFSFGKNLGEIFDKVLVDAPCSGEGTGFKSNFSLKYRRQEEINKIAGTQFQLLISAIKATKPGGNIIFSTCTINPYENEKNIKKLLDFFGNSIQIEDIKIQNKNNGVGNFLDNETEQKIGRFRPHIQKTGGFFLAKIKKKDSIQTQQKINKLTPKNPFKMQMNQKTQDEIIKFLKEKFGIIVDKKDFLFIRTPSQIYVSSQKFQEIKDLIHLEKIGIPIAKTDRNGNIRPTHYLGTIFGNMANFNYIQIDFSKAQKYSFGEDLSFDEILDGKYNQNDKYLIIKYQGHGIGIGKIVDGYIKNKYKN